MNLHREERYGIRESKCSFVPLLQPLRFTLCFVLSSQCRRGLVPGTPTRLYDAAGTTDGSVKWKPSIHVPI